MKSVLISIQPKWCELIASGKKTIEVRKTRPKLQTPFTCYIYETKGVYSVIEGKDNSRREGEIIQKQGKGKVVGEFVCDRIDEYSCEFWNDTPNYMSKNHPMEQIRILDYVDDEDPDWKEYAYVTGNEVENPNDCDLCKNSRLTYSEIRDYVGIGDKTFYGWHLSDLKIYDKPKDVGEFYLSDFKSKCEYQERGYNLDFCTAFENGTRFCKHLNCDKKRVARPPQSWCYVEE